MTDLDLRALIESAPGFTWRDFDHLLRRHHASGFLQGKAEGRADNSALDGALVQVQNMQDDVEQIIRLRDGIKEIVAASSGHGMTVEGMRLALAALLEGRDDA